MQLAELSVKRVVTTKKHFEANRFYVNLSVILSEISIIKLRVLMQDRKGINENREFLDETVSEDYRLSSLDSGFTERKDV